MLEGGSDGAGTTGAGGSSGTSGNAGAGGGGACEGDVSDDAACWATSEHGVFVSNQTGNDTTGNGTKEAPYATLTKGVESAGGKKVFVCLSATGGDYTDALSFNAADGVSIYGGFSCDTWEYSTTRKARIKSTANIALRIQNSKNLTFENLRITAADATGTGIDASSYGAFVTNSQGVLFRRVEITAGKGSAGLAGTDGLAGAEGELIPTTGIVLQKGKVAVCSSPPATQAGGVWGAQSSCGSLGGAGGTGRSDAGQPGGNGDPGGPSLMVTDPGRNNAGAGATDVNVTAPNGTEGAQGLAGSLGSAAAEAGAFSILGFLPADGDAGGQGHPGQGGGGGGASKGNGTCTGASGGAGGMGGCGGRAGGAGTGGGASVGLLVWDSGVSLEGTTVLSLAGGVGGRGGLGGGGGAGGDGASGGAGSPGNGVGASGLGGRGGPGGNGGSGSGGTGGPSVGIVFHGAVPSYGEDSDVSAQGGGEGGKGGKVLNEKAPDGATGGSAAELEVK